MKAWISTTIYNENLLALYQEVAAKVYEDGLDETQESELPKALADWLGRLRLLYGVPFDYLVPNARMLPKESVRFFYMDRNWTDRMVDGALSVGKTTTREYAHHHAVQTKMVQALDSEERRIRVRLRDPAQAKTEGEAGDLTGMLLRSRAVSGWPGMEVRAFKTDGDNQTKLRLLRMDRLAPDVMFCIFEDIPDLLEIEEPREGLQFGIDKDPDTDQYELDLRHMHGAQAGQQTGDSIPVPMRSGGRRVVDVKNLQANLETELQNQGINLKDNKLAPAEFAVQVSQFPYVQRFEGEGKRPVGDNFILESIYAAATFKVAEVMPQISEDELNILFVGGDD